METNTKIMSVKNQISFYKLELHIWKTFLLCNDLSSLHQVHTYSSATADLLTKCIGS